MLFSVEVQYMSFYQILTRKDVLDIYTSSAGLLFVNNISIYVGLFFKMWLRDDSAWGLRLYAAKTYYRSHFEIVSKSVMMTAMGGVWYNCYH